ncbi:MAG: serine/threonine-protein phosphatase [Prevotella sp.]|nr:serine/threonine-protein phosphatase [Prevotella sp.]
MLQYWLKYCKWMVSLCLLWLPLTATAQENTSDIEQLRKDMYRLFNKRDSLQQFIQVTNKLIELSKQTNNEDLLYRAWANQATILSYNGKRDQALETVKEMSEFARKNDSKYGLLLSTQTNAQLFSSLQMENEAEELFLRCISYKEQFLPNHNIAPAYLQLAKIYYNRKKKDKVLEMAEKTLQQPGLLPEQRVQALGYKCMAATIGGGDKEEFNRYYADLQRAIQETGASMNLSRRVDVYHADLNGDYEKMLELAQSMSSPLDRLFLTSEAYRRLGRWEEACNLVLKFKRYSDSINSVEVRNIALNHSLALDAARAENEAKDLKLKNQQLELEHITDELEQRRLEEEALNLSLDKQSIELRNREIELENAVVQRENDSLDRYNKDLQLSEWASKMEAQKQTEHAHHVFMTMLAIIAALVIASLAFILHRRNKHSKEIETAYGKLEDAYNRLEQTTAAKERIESELRIAREIQMGMVPHVFDAFPKELGIDLFASMTPAKEVGGDLYDFFLKDKKLYVCVGDVAGKGVPASMTMAVAVNLFRSVAKEGVTPVHIVSRINSTLSSDNESSIFVTMFIAEIDLETGRMDFCNAGHNPPLIVNNQLKPGDASRARYINMEPNAPVGLWPELDYVGESIDNIKGHTLLIYTDGLTEAENEEQQQHGEERLLHLMGKDQFVRAESTVNMILSDVASHVGNADQSDDLTILCLKIQ